MTPSDRATRRARKDAIAEQNGERKQCPACKEWILCGRGRIRLDTHIREKHPAVWAARYGRKHDDWEVPLA